jgi:hypothetical protein
MMEQKGVAPLQVGGVTPLGAAPQGAVLLVRDPVTNKYYELALDGLNSLFIPGEIAQTIDKLDSRNAKAEVVFNDAAGSGGTLGDILTDVVSIPDGEVWIISDFGVTGTAEQTIGRAKYNIRVSSFPKVDSVDKAYLAADRAVPNAATEVIYIRDGILRAVPDGETFIGGLDIELRIVGPATITLVGILTVAFDTGEEQTLTLVLYGRKVHKLVV